jgi:hypothetical protein
MHADDLPINLAADVIWSMVGKDFTNIPLWAELESFDPVVKLRTATNDMQKVCLVCLLQR